MSDDVKCGCGCNYHEHDDDIMETMTLTLEDDTELECGVIGVFEVDGLEYIALLPENDDTVLIYEYKENGDDIELSLIEDDDVFEKVSNTFNEIWEDDSCDCDE